jgi:hypothetical protein
MCCEHGHHVVEKARLLTPRTIACLSNLRPLLEEGYDVVFSELDVIVRAF